MDFITSMAPSFSKPNKLLFCSSYSELILLLVVSLRDNYCLVRLGAVLMNAEDQFFVGESFSMQQLNESCGGSIDLGQEVIPFILKILGFPEGLALRLLKPENTFLRLSRNELYFFSLPNSCFSLADGVADLSSSSSIILMFTVNTCCSFRNYCRSFSFAVAF